MLDCSSKVVQVGRLSACMKGRTIKAIDDRAVNCIEIEFTDGTELRLEAENVGHGLIGIVGYKRNPDGSNPS